MKEVYSPANAAEAHMLAHMLDGHGIAAHVMGEQLQGATGDLPAGGFIKLMVADEDHARARALILEWERVQTDATPSETFSPKRRFPIFTAVAALSVGLLAGAFGRDLMHAGPAFDGNQLAYDQNDDGRPDLTYFYSASSYPQRSEADYNHDGRVDRITRYDNEGVPTQEESDDDFDGRSETKTTFEHGSVERQEVDTEGNGVADIFRTYYNGILAVEQVHDSRVGRLAVTNYYENWMLVRSEADLDRDGFAETLRTYDRFGEITSEETRQRPN